MNEVRLVRLNFHEGALDSIDTFDADSATILNPEQRHHPGRNEADTIFSREFKYPADSAVLRLGLVLNLKCHEAHLRCA